MNTISSRSKMSITTPKLADLFQFFLQKGILPQLAIVHVHLVVVTKIFYSVGNVDALDIKQVNALNEHLVLLSDDNPKLDFLLLEDEKGLEKANLRDVPRGIALADAFLALDLYVVLKVVVRVKASDGIPVPWPHPFDRALVLVTQDVGTQKVNTLLQANPLENFSGNLVLYKIPARNCSHDRSLVAVYTVAATSIG